MFESESQRFEERKNKADRYFAELCLLLPSTAQNQKCSTVYDKQMPLSGVLFKIGPIVLAALGDSPVATVGGDFTSLLLRVF